MVQSRGCIEYNQDEAKLGPEAESLKHKNKIVSRTLKAQSLKFTAYCLNNN